MTLYVKQWWNNDEFMFTVECLVAQESIFFLDGSAMVDHI